MQKLSKVQIGKIGGEKTRELHKQLNAKKIIKYNKFPSKCINCGNILPYNKKSNKFCNRKCSAEYNNQHSKNSSLVRWNCLYCNKNNITLRWKIGTYCNSQCHKLHIRATRIKQWLENDISWNTNFPDWAKEYLKKTKGNHCHICGILEWNGTELTLEGDHIDGNSNNNHPDNLRLVCPNCHSLTPTYKNKNKGNGRQRRRAAIK